MGTIAYILKRLCLDGHSQVVRGDSLATGDTIHKVSGININRHYLERMATPLLHKTRGRLLRVLATFL